MPKLRHLKERENWTYTDKWVIKKNNSKKFSLKRHFYYNKKLCFVVKKSQIEKANFGLYAGRDFGKDQVVAYYVGKTLIEKKNNLYFYTGFINTYGNQDFNKWLKTSEGGYVMQVGNKWIDGSKDNFNGTGFINDSYKSKFKTNLKLNTKGGFKTLKNINKGEELFFQYSKGNTYWKV